MRSLLTGLAVLAVAGAMAAPAHAGREGTLTLDGRWDFRFAPDDRGNAEKWFLAGVPFDRALTVPGCWDAQSVGAPTDKLRHNAIGVGWYRRSLPIPAAWRGNHVWLVVGGAHRSVRVWVNGQYLGEHIGYPTSARFDLTPALSGFGPQQLVLAVDSRKDADRDPLAGAMDLLDYMDVTWGGIYEHVWLEATDEQWIADAFVAPAPAAHRATAEVTLGHSGSDSPELTLAYAVSLASPSPGRALASGECPVAAAAGATRLNLQLPNAPLWTPDSPNLLSLDLALKRGGQVIDRYSVRFGLRRLTVDGADFRLNGDRFFLRGYGDDYTFPLTIAAPAGTGFWRKYLQLRKDFGFNGVRHHSTMMSESYLAAADEVGMFIQPELPIAYEPFFQNATPTGRKLYPQVLADYIRQMRNHPSVLAWCMGNESYQGLAIGTELYDLAKSLDPTRPVIDTDGLPQGAQRRTLDYHSVQFDEFSLDALPWGAGHNKYTMPNPTRPVIVHEMSNISVLPNPADIRDYSGAVRPFWLEAMRDAVHKQHLEDRVPDMLRASRRLQASLLKLNLEAARLSPAIRGHYQWLFRDYWTQSTGFVDQFDRARAITPELSRQFVSDTVLLWDRERCNYRAGEKLPLRVFLSDFRPASAPPLRAVQVRLAGREVALTRPQAVGDRGLLGPWIGEIALPSPARPQKLVLEARAGSVHNDWPIWVFPPPPAPEAKVLVRPRLTEALLERVARGERLLITDDTSTFPVLQASLKPAWWKGDDTSDHSYGNMMDAHPALRGFPADGYGDLQAAGLLHKRPVVMLDDVPGHLQPIVWCLDVPWRMRRKAYLFEARVGDGYLLVSTMNLSPRSRSEDPAAAEMLACLTRYLGSAECHPTHRLPLTWLHGRVQRLQLPESATWVEGFSEVVTTTGENTSWHTYRGEDMVVHSVRQMDGNQRLTWRTARVPEPWPHRTATFVWGGGIGWRSEPGGGHFSVALNGQPLLDFPFVTESARWRSPDDAVTLDYVMRRGDSEDTFGLFFLTVPADRIQPGRPTELALTATAQNSHRWVSVTPYTDVVETQRSD